MPRWPIIAIGTLVGENPQAPKSQDKSCGCAFFQIAYSPFGKKEKDTGGLNGQVRLPIMIIYSFVLFAHLFHVSADGERFLH